MLIRSHHRARARGRRAVALLITTLLMLATFVGLAGTVAAQEDESQEGEGPTGLAVSGTARVGRDAVEGIRFEVSADGVVVGEAVTDGDGEWEVVVGEPGVYLVTLDVTTLPEGVELRDPDVTQREVELVDRSRSAIFALTGDAGGAEGGTSQAAIDSTFERYLDRFVSGIRVGSTNGYRCLICSAAAGWPAWSF